MKSTFLLVALVLLFIPKSRSQVTYACDFNDSLSQPYVSGQPCDEISVTPREIANFPNINFTVAFHFIGNAQGQNFHCDPNDPSTNLYAPQLINDVIAEMNLRMSKALFISSQEYDAKMTWKARRNIWST